MNKHISDDKLDQMMRTLLSDASPAEDELVYIADSPTVWWAVQREINEQKVVKSPWPPANLIRRWLMIAIPTAAAAALLISLFVFRSTPVQQASNPPVVENIPVAKVEGPQTPLPTNTEAATITPASKPVSRSTAVPKPVNAVLRVRKQTITPTTASVEKKGEIKTEFIALTYARDPESGQIVRVKVPSSMMVTLGVVANVEKPTALVDAEVLVGDDGLTRAIRFIR